MITWGYSDMFVHIVECISTDLYYEIENGRLLLDICKKRLQQLCNIHHAILCVMNPLVSVGIECVVCHIRDEVCLLPHTDLSRYFADIPERKDSCKAMKQDTETIPCLTRQQRRSGICFGMYGTYRRGNGNDQGVL